MSTVTLDQHCSVDVTLKVSRDSDPPIDVLAGALVNESFITEETFLNLTPPVGESFISEETFLRLNAPVGESIIIEESLLRINSPIYGSLFVTEVLRSIAAAIVMDRTVRIENIGNISMDRIEQIDSQIIFPGIVSGNMNIDKLLTTEYDLPRKGI